MTFTEMFNQVKDAFKDADVSEIKEHLAYQFNITGEGEGIFYAEVKNGTLYIEPYEYYDRDAIFTCRSDVLLKIITGKINPITAVTLGKLRVDGNIDKALKLKEMVKG